LETFNVTKAAYNKYLKIKVETSPTAQPLCIKGEELCNAILVAIDDFNKPHGY